MTQFLNVESEINRIRAEMKRLEEEAMMRLRPAALALVQELMANTPVWSGEAIRNYAVGVGKPPSGSTVAPVGGRVPFPNRTGLNLAGEVRRGPNETATLTDAANALAGLPKKLTNIFVVSLLDAGKWDLIDSGSAPTPERSRYPGGVSRLAVQSVRGRFGDLFE